MHDADIPTPDSSPLRTALHARGWYSSPSTSAAAKWLCSTRRSLLGPRVSALGEGRLSTLSALVLFAEGGNSAVIGCMGQLACTCSKGIDPTSWLGHAKYMYAVRRGSELPENANSKIFKFTAHTSAVHTKSYA